MTKKYPFEKARFIKSAVAPKDYPILRNLSGDIMPEIAVAGRSNVGKSSLLNHLFQTPGLVKTSSVPGKTQIINFFTLDHAIGFVDLPGYGYAKVPQTIRQQWGPMIQNYFETRSTLKAVLLLIDIRRIPNEEDLQMLDWCRYRQLPCIVILTKVDKVNQSERAANRKKILAALDAVDPAHSIEYSTTKGLGRIKLIKMLHEVLDEE